MSMFFHSAVTAISAMYRLWQDNVLGGWWDPSDFSTMFQDSAGTIPVTAVGDPVGLLLDKSGRGRHLMNVSTTGRPFLRIDAQGKYFLEFDGVDDQLYSTEGLWAGSQMFACLSLKMMAATTGAAFELTKDPDNIAGSFNFYVASAGTGITANVRGSSNIQNDGVFSMGPVGTLCVVSAMWDLSKTTNAEQKIVRFNGVATANPTPLKIAGNPSTFANAAVYVGRRGKPADPCRLGFYGGAIVGRIMTVPEAMVVEQYMAQKSGQVF